MLEITAGILLLFTEAAFDLPYKKAIYLKLDDARIVIDMRVNANIIINISI